MELVVIEKTKKRLIFTLRGSTHTLCNSLKEELWNDKAVTASAYSIDHPLIGIPKFVVDTDGSKTPEQAIDDAIGRLKKTNKSFATAFSKL